MMECSGDTTGEGQLILCMMVHMVETCDSPIYGISINLDHVCKLKRPVAINVMLKFFKYSIRFIRCIWLEKKLSSIWSTSTIMVIVGYYTSKS